MIVKDSTMIKSFSKGSWNKRAIFLIAFKWPLCSLFAHHLPRHSSHSFYSWNLRASSTLYYVIIVREARHNVS